MARISAEDEHTYPLRTAARLTGLSPALLRAWEQRYGAVAPSRTAGGTRRYRSGDIERLRLLKAAVDAGHRIGQVARLDLAQLRERVAASEARPVAQLEEILDSLDRLDAVEAQRLLSLQLAALGAPRFARELVCPLVREIGERWARERMGVSSEHLASSLLRSLLGSALHPTSASLLGPRVLFATPTGERHELGLLMAAVTALGAGANPLYLGAELPVEALLAAAERAAVGALGLSLVTVPNPHAVRAVRALRGGVADEVRVWVGGAGSVEAGELAGVDRTATLEDFEQQVMLLVSCAEPR